jgi:hypothetical protein
MPVVMRKHRFVRKEYGSPKMSNWESRGKEVNPIDRRYPEKTCTEAMGTERIVAPVGVCPIDKGRSSPG